MRVVTVSLLALLMATSLMAQEPQQEQRERQREHVVRRGDTLWDLAGRYLSNPFRWPRIHEVNTRIVADPHWIYPEQVLVIPGIRDAVSAHEPVGVPLAGAPAAPGQPEAAQLAAEPARTLFYRDPPIRSQDRPTVLLEPTAERVPVKPGEFFRAEYLSPADVLPVVARVLRSARHSTAVPAHLAPSAHPRDQVFLSYAAGVAPAIGDRLLVVAVGRPVGAAGPEVRIIDPRAVVRVVELEPEVVRVEIEEQFGRVVSGHLALSLDLYPDFLASDAEPVAGDWDLEGTILDMADQQELYSIMSRGFINLGAAHGVQVGDIFEAYLPARPVATASGSWGEELPTQSVAALRVLRVTDTTATVVVDQLVRPELAAGLAVRRVRKMP